jgi:sulfoxide reductase heme-binding subunit YedZ
MKRAIASIPLLYAFLLAPGFSSIWGLYDRTWYYPQLMHDSGLWSVQLLLITIAVSPILRVINLLGTGHEIGRWLLKRRRHFGIASFVFAMVHLVHYLLYTDVFYDIAYDAITFRFATGWAALLIFAALAVTSNNTAVRALGRRWKKLHLWIYPAIGLTFFHWYLFDHFTGRVIFWFVVALGIKCSHFLLQNRPWQWLTHIRKSES